MTVDLVPSELPAWLKNLNLPKLVAGPAGEAISRLISGAADIPAAWLEQKAAAIRSKTEAQKAVAAAIAEQVAHSIKGDVALIERATNALIAKELRKQANKESVARKSIEYLRDEPAPGEAPKKPEEDWLNMFEQYAEHASTEKLQDLWARVLAGEIRRPKSFSLRTLRFIAELDQETAMLFERYADGIFDRDFMLKGTADTLADLLKLQERELVSEVSGTVSSVMSINKDGDLFIGLGDRKIRIVGKAGTKINIRCSVVTRVGMEIASILHVPFNRGHAERLVKEMPKGNVERIELGVFTPQPSGFLYQREDILWEKPMPKANPKVGS